MVMTGLFGNDLLALTIVDGARPGIALPRLFVLWMKCRIGLRLLWIVYRNESVATPKLHSSQHCR